ncbi:MULTISPECIES: pilus assembly protein CpaE [unclassified Sphingopyxis]|uniref:pilus assembly protein CpaE n=1 Tax=unclassified Sphingopyxis TaxID=2614943 RepID=UPI0007308595|nr:MULTISPECIES: pilus assembly protein CpaE [unclassified Sphingopyxis]KTE23336.1 pilus assembly protein CpaE [Sphingopyxis sp. H057]KTE51989.1 pilus assembly protein CpaE [Sphingopyxis sp. H073]KTE52377.1 pilus assembly protein CpaE [Sphingopyxis sp. H071]KTE59732.1 pilus assembly protein CpaE [Sphingopyxis sp. H107]KTE64695.1 pilus assembly protein CpaE [Sphingopyxis sp. H100]
MNAPFKAAGLRDPFNAFVCDDDTLELIRVAAADMGWPTEKCNKGGLRNAVQSLSVSASPNILFVDMSESGDPINDINALAEVCEPGTVVIAAGQVNDVRLYRDLLSSGIQDYLLKPLSLDQVRESLTMAQAMLSAPKHADMHDDKPHHMMAVVGVRGGVGASLVSTSLAWAISEQADRQTALLDLDVHFGTGALTLDLEPGRGLIDAIDNPSRIDGLFIERAMVRASDKLSLLSAEAPIHQPVMTDGSAFFQLEEELRNAFEMTIVDIPRHVLIPFPHLVQEVGTILLVSDVTLASARDTIRLLSWFKQNVPGARVILVANKFQNAVGELSRKEFESSIERPIDFTIPFDPKLVSQSAKLGKSYAEICKGTKAGQVWTSLMRLVIDGADESAEEAPVAPAKAKAKAKSGGSLFDKIGGLGTLVTKKAK